MNMTHAMSNFFFYWNNLQWSVLAAFHFSFFFKLKLNYTKTVFFNFCIKTAIKLY